jgi:4-amino-4-deoxy-L-arabinose transferase-like glycosyltransferase
MFLPRLFAGGIALGFGLLVLLVIGVLDLFGALNTVGKSIANSNDVKEMSLSGAPGWLRVLAGFNIRIFYVGVALIVAGACRVSVIGTMDALAPWSGPLLFALGIVVLILARLFRRPFDGDLHQGFLVVSLATATVMSTLGSHGLWDCWETHYGEIARRQLEQDDWISLFWENKWFYSKPVLIFWLMNFGMVLFGVQMGPDMISGHAEWGLRFFVGVLSIAVLFGLYSLIAKRVSKRAGLFVALVFGTMPLFNFMTRQAITDLPFVGLMTLSVVFFLLGITVDKDLEAEPRLFPLGRGRYLPLSGFHAVVIGYVAVVVPQAMYLATRSSSFVFGTVGRDDIKVVGTAGRLLDYRLSDLAYSVFGFQLGGAFDLSLDWVLLGLAFLIPFGVVLFTLRRERRISRLCYHGMYLTLGLSVMAKGLAGLVMPFLGLIGFWLVIAPWKDLGFKPKRMWKFLAWHIDKARQLDILRGIAMFLFVGAPWYVAMIVRHGNAFINRFFIHDHIKRLSVGVHGDTGTLQYFIKQFAYGAFPWVALLPLAMLAWPSLTGWRKWQGGKSRSELAKQTIFLFAACWALLSFTLLTVMITKYHHYVFPLLPPTAILIGLFLDDIWEKRVTNVGLVVLVGIGTIAVVANDLIVDPVKSKGVLDGYAQLVGLFIYKYSRPYPEGDAWNYSSQILGFSIAFGVLLVGWLSAKWRRIAMVATVLSILAFSHWVSQHYMIQLAPHWSQKHVIEEYYAKRKSPAERLVAYQMNWKGENFYTGNRVVVHVSTKNKDFEKWVNEHRGERHFFITEQSRFERMSRRAKAKSGPIEPLGDTCNKYKVGVAEEL